MKRSKVRREEVREECKYTEMRKEKEELKQ